MESDKLRQKYFSYSIFIVFVFFTFSTYWYYDTIKDVIYSYIHNNEYIAITLFAGLLEGIPQFLPPDLLIVFGKMLELRTLYTLLFLIIGTTVGSYLSYLVGYWGGEKVALKFISRTRYDHSTAFLKKYGKIGLPLISITHLPYFPIMLGAIKYNLREFFLYGILVRIMKYSATSYLIYYLGSIGYLDQYASWFGY